MATASLFKDPQAELDYGVNWSKEWMRAGDAIQSFSVEVTDGMKNPPAGDDIEVMDGDQAPSNNSGTIVFWLAKGRAGVTYSITCSIVTTAGRKDERTVQVKIKDM